MDSLIAELTTAPAAAAAREESVNLRRNGKIARLPKETRDMINRMIDDGLPARVIIDELGDAGEGLNAQNITNWKQGGYQDHLKTQERIERIRIQTETAIDILKGTADLDTAKIHEATRKAAAVQLFEAVWGQGPDALLKLVEAEPARYLRLLNIICNFSNAALAREKFQWLMKQAEATAPAGPAARNPSTAVRCPPFRVSPLGAPAQNHPRRCCSPARIKPIQGNSSSRKLCHLLPGNRSVKAFEHRPKRPFRAFPRVAHRAASHRRNKDFACLESSFCRQ
jgi:hypothetical protein